MSKKNPFDHSDIQGKKGKFILYGGISVSTIIALVIGVIIENVLISMGIALVLWIIVVIIYFVSGAANEDFKLQEEAEKRDVHAIENELKAIRDETPSQRHTRLGLPMICPSCNKKVSEWRYADSSTNIKKQTVKRYICSECGFDINR